MMRPGGDISALDRPEVLSRLFHPRKDVKSTPPEGATDFHITVENTVQIATRFFPGDPAGPHLIFFHGNGEIAGDYDDIGPVYNRCGLSFLVVDYRGYGRSEGKPSASSLLSDAHSVFTETTSWFKQQDRTGLLIVMGRSLGSVPALEVASHYHSEIAGLILESGFARTVPLLNRLGVATDTLKITEADGFANFAKIKDVGKPTLIIHGQNDDIIPLADGEILQANSGASIKQFMLAPGCGHNDILLRCAKPYFNTIERFAAALTRLQKKAENRGGFNRMYPRR
jgi:pimeloyl-ACP methyl ester carboxylesterase